MTKDEFEKGYATRSGVTVEWLYKHGNFGIPCDCGKAGCAGWQMKFPDQYNLLAIRSCRFLTDTTPLKEFRELIKDWPEIDGGEPTTIRMMIIMPPDTGEESPTVCMDLVRPIPFDIVIGEE